MALKRAFKQSDRVEVSSEDLQACTGLCEVCVWGGWLCFCWRRVLIVYVCVCVCVENERTVGS